MNKRLWLVTILIISMVLSSCSGGGSNVSDEGVDYSASIIDSITAVNAGALGVAVNSPFRIKTNKDVSEEALAKLVLVTPEVDFDVKKEGDKDFLLTPKESLDSQTVYQIAALSDINTENIFAWAFQTEKTGKVKSVFPRNQADNVPLNTGIEIAFTYTPEKEVDKYFKIDPQVDGTFEYYENKVIFLPNKLDKNKVYKITVEKGLDFTDYDQPTTESYSFSFKTMTESFYDKFYFSFHDQMYTFDTETAPYFAGYSNMPKDFDLTDAKVYKFDKTNTFIEWLKKTEMPYEWPYMSEMEQKGYDTSDLEYLEEYSQNYNVDLSGTDHVVFDDTLDEGYYFMTFTVEDVTNYTFFQISDLKTYLISDHNKKILWIHDALTNIPFDGASVSIDKNKAVKTNDEGIAVAPDIVDLDNPEYGYIQITGNNKNIPYVMQVSNTKQSPIVYGRYADSFIPDTYNSDYWQYLHLDRYRYLPNEEVNYFGVAIDRDTNAPAEDVVIKLTTSSYANGVYDTIILEEKEVTLSENGSYEGTIDISPYEIGYYDVRVFSKGEPIEQSSFFISEFSKPKYVVGLDVEETKIFADEKTNAFIDAAFYEGTPVSHMKFDYEYYTNYNNRINGVLETDEDGKAQLVITPNSKRNSWHPDSLWLRFSNADAEEENIHLTKSIQVFPKKTMVNISFENDDNAKDTFVTIATNLIDLDRDDNTGDVVDSDLEITVKEIYYEKIETGQSYDYINKVVKKTYQSERRERIFDTMSGRTTNGKFTFDATLDDDKNYEVIVTAKDIDNSHIIETGYIYNYYQSFYDYDYYELKVDQEKDDDYKYSFKLGEIVKMSLVDENSDTPTDGKTLFLNIKDEIDSTEISSDNKYSFTFEKRLIPNNHVKAVYFDGKNYYQVNEQWVGYDYEDDVLDITVKEDKTSYRPGEPITLDIEVLDKDKKPVSADVNVLIMDKKMYDVAGNNPNIMSQLYRWQHDTHILDEQVPSAEARMNGFGAEKGGDMAGDGSLVRENFKNVAFFKTVKADEFGKVNVSFDLPDDVTSWFVITEAVTIDLKGGTQTQEVYATLPLFVDTIFNDYFTSDDQPSIALRTFGSQVDIEEVVIYEVVVENLDSKKTYEYSGKGKSFSLTNIKLNRLSEGHCKITVTAKQGDLSDTFVREFDVLPGILRINRNDQYTLSNDLKLASVEGQHIIKFYNGLMKEYESMASSLLYNSYGERVDQKMAREFVSTYFGEVFNYYMPSETKIYFNDFQAQKGISILPYAEPSYKVSAQMAAFAKDYFDEASLISYFEEGIINKDNDTTDIAYALWGLAELKEPILDEIQQSIEIIDELNIEEKIIVGNAAAAIGDLSNAKKIYDDIKKDHVKSSSRYLYVKDSNKNVQVTNTGLMAILSSKLNLNDSELYINYIDDAKSDKELVNLDLLICLYESSIKHLEQEAIKPVVTTFIYAYKGTSKEVTLTNSESYSMILTQDEIDHMTFEQIDGYITMDVIYQGKANDIELTEDFSFDIAYNQQTTKQSDELKITINPSFEKDAITGRYEIVVPIPAGYIFQDREYHGIDENYWYGHSYDEKNYTVGFYYNALEDKYPRVIEYNLRAVLPGEYNTDESVMINNNRDMIYKNENQILKIVE